MALIPFASKFPGRTQTRCRSPNWSRGKPPGPGLQQIPDRAAQIPRKGGAPLLVIHDPQFFPRFRLAQNGFDKILSRGARKARPCGRSDGPPPIPGGRSPLEASIGHRCSGAREDHPAYRAFGRRRRKHNPCSSGPAGPERPKPQAPDFGPLRHSRQKPNPPGFRTRPRRCRPRN